MFGRPTGTSHKERTVPHIRQRKEKHEVLCGWKTPKTEDDSDISNWAKKRQLQDCRTDNGRQAPPRWDHYLCTVIKKCRALESVQVFIDDSLSVSLRPTPSHLEREPTKVKLKHSSSMPALKIGKANAIPEEQEGSLKDGQQKEAVIKEEDVALSEKAEPSTNAAKETGDENSKQIKMDTVNDGVKTENNGDKDSGEQQDQASTGDQSELSQKGDTVTETLESGDVITDRTENSASSERTTESSNKVQDKTPPKFMYTRSNITLNVHPSFMPLSNCQNHVKAPDLQTESDDDYEDDQKEAVFESVHKLNNTSRNGAYLPKRQSTETRLLHTTNLTNNAVLPHYVSKRSLLPGNGSFSSKSESNISRIQDHSHDIAVAQIQPSSGHALNGMSIASIKSGQRVHSAITDSSNNMNEFAQDPQQEKKMTQKQVMLVLKKVTLKDDLGDLYKDEKHENPFQQTHALLSSHNHKYDLPSTAVVQGKTSKRPSEKEQGLKRLRSGKHRSICFPIGDLLPAVDTSIRNSMPARHYRSIDHPGLEKEPLDGGKENVVSFDEGLSSMRQGIEIIRVKSNILGPPAFRPQNGKSPLQRAKENTTKRTHGNNPLSQTQIAEVTDFSKTFWKSSAGNLYANPVRSRPSSRNEDEARTNSSRLSKKWKADHNPEAPSATELHQVSKTLSTRLNQLNRQRGPETTGLLGRESVT